jgi:GMP synthase-like glutamine amidotransferase
MGRRLAAADMNVLVLQHIACEPPGVYESVLRERRLIADAVRAEMPYWGVCLGAQLRAASLGAAVYQGHRPEVGLLPVELTNEARSDAVFGVLTPSLMMLQWHNDTFDLPNFAVRLAGSSEYPNQAFRVGNADGIQFHLEVSTGIVRQWARVPSYAASLERTLGAGAADSLLAEVEQREGDMRTRGRVIFEGWIDAAVDGLCGGARWA